VAVRPFCQVTQRCTTKQAGLWDEGETTRRTENIISPPDVSSCGMIQNPKPTTHTRTQLFVFAFALTSMITQANGDWEAEFVDRWAPSGEKYVQRALEDKLASALERERVLRQQVIAAATPFLLL
jgi:hypothetical protein